MESDQCAATGESGAEEKRRRREVRGREEVTPGLGRGGGRDLSGGRVCAPRARVCWGGKGPRDGDRHIV